MDGFFLSLFLIATFLGGLTSGLAGFAMGLVVSGIWLHIMTPLETAALIVAYGLLTQGYGMWKLRYALNWRAVAPYVISGAVGVPLGTALLAYVRPDYVRIGIGVLLVLYSVYGLARPAFKPVKAGLAADLGIGFLNGVLGGLTGLIGIILAVWCQARGLGKDAQRSIFQPVTFLAAIVTLVSLAFAGAITVETVKLYLLGVPVLLAGLWSGFRLYGKLDDAAFRRIVLLLLLLSGLSLIVPRLPF